MWVWSVAPPTNYLPIISKSVASQHPGCQFPLRGSYERLISLNFNIVVMIPEPWNHRGGGGELKRWVENVLIICWTSKIQLRLVHILIPVNTNILFTPITSQRS